MAYEELRINWGGETFYFVTRGENPFTEKEAIEFLRNRTMKVAESANDAVPPIETEYVEEILNRIEESKEETMEKASTFTIPDNKTARRVFMQDIRSGLDFCVNKYNVSKEKIVAEAQRIAPHMHVEKLKG